jgi:hypothetical protein
MDPEIKEKTFRAVLDPDASKVKILNAVDQEPIRLDRWIEVSGHTGRYVWDVIVFFGKQWVDILDHQRLRPYNVYLNLRLHNGRTRVVKAPISGTVVVTSEAKERTLQKAIFGNEGEQ